MQGFVLLILFNIWGLFVIYFISNMYPSKKNPFYGTFIETIKSNLESCGESVVLLSLNKENLFIKKILKYIVFYFNILKCFFASNRNDIFYIHFVTHSSLPIVIGSLFIKRKVVLNFHGSDIFISGGFLKKFISNMINKKAVAIAYKIVVPSDFYKKVVMDKFSVSEERVCVSASGGIDLNKINKIKKVSKKHTSDEFVLGCFGRITPSKGVFILLKALELVDIAKHKISVIIIGPIDKKFEKFFFVAIENMKFKGVHVIPGMSHNEILDMYNEIDVFIFPSLKESLGLVGLEAMAFNKPVIGSNIEGITSYLCHDYNGYLFDAGSPEKLANAIGQYIQLSPEKKKEMAMNCEETANRYSCRAVTEKLLIDCFGR